MRKAVVLVGLMSVVLGLGREAFGNNRTDDPLGIAVSPQTLILGVEQSGRVTVHTAIAGSVVDRATVALNGIPASSTWVDLRGNLVAGFGEADVKAIVEPDEATLTLTGNRLDGTPFAGSDTVRVIEASSESEIVAALEESSCGSGVAPPLASMLAVLGVSALVRRRP